ncbi:DUF402 domain-containing protein [Streptomyces sp. NPDC050856]|uniref:DUF402 domain-containing protein n=1 Tax=Streptomyces sp. NPDC050856 TaxID=3154939 RepID=UPI0033D194C0
MATGVWELAAAVWQETELLLWKPPAAWFSVNAFYTSAGLRNWYVNFEHPTRRTTYGFDTFDLTVDLVIDPDLTSWRWKDEDEYTHVRRLGIVTDTEHQAVDAARDQVLAMLAERSGPFADAAAWTAWRWNPAWPAPALPRSAKSREGVVPTGGSPRAHPSGRAAGRFGEGSRRLWLAGPWAALQSARG